MVKDMEMKHLEPFAWGYMHSPRPDAESRIANGIYAFAEEYEIRFDPKRRSHEQILKGVKTDD